MEHIQSHTNLSFDFHKKVSLYIFDRVSVF